MASIPRRSGVGSAPISNALGCHRKRGANGTISSKLPGSQEGGGLMDGRILSDRRGSVVRLHRRGHGNVANSRNTLAAGEISRSDGATNVAAGSDQHKLLFCRMLLDTFSPYKPESIAWPELDDEARRHLCALPIWDIAVQTEGRACLRVLSYGETVSDPLLQRAIRLNAFEEARHKRLLNCMVSHYGIRLAEEPPYREPRDPEW